MNATNTTLLELAGMAALVAASFVQFGTAAGVAALGVALFATGYFGGAS